MSMGDAQQHLDVLPVLLPDRLGQFFTGDKIGVEASRRSLSLLSRSSTRWAARSRSRLSNQDASWTVTESPSIWSN